MKYFYEFQLKLIRISILIFRFTDKIIFDFILIINKDTKLEKT